MDKIGVVYRISCKDCTSVYIGQTSTTLKKRYCEHSTNIKNADERPVVAMHSVDNKHLFDFGNIATLNNEPNKCKREFPEMLIIRKD